MTEAPLILIVDDEAINLKVLSWALSEAGFRTITARGGPEALALAESRKPDLVILDILMPGDDGFAVCQKLQASPHMRDVPVIFLSGLTDTHDKVRGLEMGAVDYVTKPFSGGEVVARARIHLKLRQARQALIAEQAAKLSSLRQAQLAILADPGEMPGARFAVRYQALNEAGGDIYDVFSPSENTYCYMVADVTGHDLGASFWTPAVKTLLRQNAGPLYGPAETFANMNGVLLQVLSPNQVLTAACLTLNRATGQAFLVRAGHPEPVLARAGGMPYLLAPEGDVLGGFESAHFEVMSMRLKPGDRVYLYTDGLLERPGKTFAQGQAALLDACEKTRPLPLEDALEEILQSILPKETNPADDVVLLGVEV
jgi:sigma-B regulation protein RsbU (phosphoserine phosphatase)